MNPNSPPTIPDPLNERETEILQLLAQRWTDREIATRLLLSVETVKWYNKQIYGKLGVVGRRAAAEWAIQAVAIPATLAHVDVPTYLTPFVGRIREVEEIITLLTSPTCRLLTVHGTGGMGKTRLAMEVARRVAPRYADGVYVVELAPLTDPATLPSALLEAVGGSGSPRLDPLLSLQAHLRDKRCLIVLDNVEHLLEGVGVVADLLHAAQKVQLIATSRHRLSLYGEVVYPLSGLVVETADDATMSDAVTLFRTRAQAVNPNYGENTDDTNTLLAICRLVEGMPLAIELAAAWADTLSAKDILHALTEGMDLLTAEWRDITPRHRNLRATFDQSWQRLPDAARRVFAAVSVFRGGFDSTAAAWVARATVASLKTLVQTAMIRFDSATGRYTVHELLRQFGAEQLANAGEHQGVVQAHSHYFARFLDSRVADIQGQRQRAALDEVETEFANIEQAWHNAVLAKDAATLDLMIDVLDMFAERRGHSRRVVALFGEARQQFAPTTDAQPLRVWERVLARCHPSIQEGAPFVLKAYELAVAANDLTEIAYTLYARSYYGALGEPHYQLGCDLLEESLDRFRQLGNRYFEMLVLTDLGFVYALLDRTDLYLHARQRAYEIAVEIGDTHMAAHNRGGLGSYYLNNEGNLDVAEPLFHQAMELAARGNDVGMLQDMRIRVAWLCFFRGDIAAARGAIDEAQGVVRDASPTGNYARAMHQALRGTLASLGGHPQEGLDLCATAAPLLRDRPIRYFYALFGATLSALSAGNYATAQEWLRETLGFNFLKSNPVILAMCLALVSVLVAQRGEDERAVVLLGTAVANLHQAGGWLDQWEVMLSHRTSLRARLGDRDFERLWEEGQVQDLAGAVSTFSLD